MATGTIFTGRQSEFLLKPESAFGVAPSGNWLQSPFFTQALAGSEPFEDNPVLGMPQFTARDPNDPGPGLASAGGSVRVPMCLNHIGYWLKLACGAPVTAADDTDYTHVFTSGAAVLPTYGLEFKVAAAKFRQHLGVAARSIKFAQAKEAGFRGIDLDLVHKKENRLGSSGGGTPAEPLALQQFAAVIGGVLWNDAMVGRALTVDLTYGTGVDGERYVDGSNDAYISEVVASGDTSLVGTITVRGQNDALDADAVSKTARKLELLYQISETKSLSIVAPRCFVEPSGLPIPGPGGTEQTFAFRAAQTAEAAMVTFTLKNQTATYP